MEDVILLIEDEITTGEMLKEALEFSEMQVVWAKDGSEALSAVKQKKFDLIVLDLKLPGGLGDEILEEIREIDAYVEVIVHTNYSTKTFDPPVIQRLFKLGVSEYMNKGGDADLVQVVEKIKEKLRPFSEEERTQILEYMPKKSFNESA